ncbi:primosomal replication protein PriC [Psychrobium sp. 1_MG-2023]|uniref:primosomal replication protein PriC n=1 Tax=Psychrobium sp. 1_MG-2023 TaxID=3062624 RepID=UPI000C346C74|nr:primosomal replication protein PriC [Psychrobium sp. 1_MG-2023]MDP2560845.1 primosomal replication protein PriC [Psychrobium sp. 1_MG-2023]PKF56719.1 prephenate dehydrogenase [Alteromonadales bacterium alter-6D02]
MSHSPLFAALTENIRLIYRQSIDADKAIDELRQQDMAKFSAIFDEQQGFKTKANRFTPYAEELGNDLVALQQAESDDVPTLVQPLVAKIEIQLQLLQVFKSNLKSKPKK